MQYLRAEFQAAPANCRPSWRWIYIRGERQCRQVLALRFIPSDAVDVALA